MAYFEVTKLSDRLNHHGAIGERRANDEASFEAADGCFWKALEHYLRDWQGVELAAAMLTARPFSVLLDECGENVRMYARPTNIMDHNRDRYVAGRIYYKIKRLH